MLLLLGAGGAIVVLLRRDSSDESIFYDEDEWEDEEEEHGEQEVTPILPPLAPDRPSVDEASLALEATETDDFEENETKPEEPVMADETEHEATEVEKAEDPADDPWADVDHS